ncbi:MAG: DUF4375 domain-containing protein [Bryobacteraceae bacterium]|jgi:hypothetical protein
MTNLKWLEEYSGQTAARLGEESLSGAERVVLAVEALEREVNNGGYSQFFTNTPAFVPTVVDSLLRAAITGSAIDALLLRDLTVQNIANAMAAEDDDINDELSRCDQLYYQSGESIEDQLFAFINANKDSITL